MAMWRAVGSCSPACVTVDGNAPSVTRGRRDGAIVPRLDQMDQFLAFVAAVLLALIHVLAGQLHVLRVVPRSSWLSIAGGASVAYVFLHVLPKLGNQRASLGELVGVVEHPAHLVALLGLGTFFGLERAAVASRRDENDQDATTPGVFWVHVVSFGLYNATIGYLLLGEADSVAGLALYSVAMALHFVVNDVGLQNHHKERYENHGRWILATAVLLGWGLGVIVTVPDVWMGMGFAFLSGGVVMNVLKEELPEDRESRFWAFALGLSGYAALLVFAAQ